MTGHRTLGEMDELFGSTGVAAADQERKRRIEREIGLLALLREDDWHGGVQDVPNDAVNSANKHVEVTDLPTGKA